MTKASLDQPAAYFCTRMVVLGRLVAQSDEMSAMLDGITIGNRLGP